MNRTHRFSLFAPLLLVVSVGCSGDGAGADGPEGGSGSATTAGSSNPGTGGTVSTTGGTPSNVPLAGSGQAIGGGDQGTFFNPDMSVQVMPAAGGTGGSGNGGSGGSIPGDGNSYTSTIKGSITGTAVFTQRGEDVDLVVNLNNCPNGNHQFRIHDGYSCDNASTEGMPWGARGTGIGPDTGIACSGNKGTLMYTRSGADKTKNWTVGDHIVETDLTAHVVIISDEKDPNSRASCGNFF